MQILTNIENIIRVKYARIAKILINMRRDTNATAAGIMQRTKRGRLCTYKMNYLTLQF